MKHFSSYIVLYKRHKTKKTSFFPPLLLWSIFKRFIWTDTNHRSVTQLVSWVAASLQCVPTPTCPPSTLHRMRRGRCRAALSFNQASTCSVWSPATYLSCDIRQTGQLGWSNILAHSVDNSIQPVELPTRVFHKLVIREKKYCLHVCFCLFSICNLCFVKRWGGLES